MGSVEGNVSRVKFRNLAHLEERIQKIVEQVPRVKICYSVWGK